MREAVPYALGVAVSPIPIAATALLLTCRRALANGLSFLAGWIGGVAVPAFLFVGLVELAGVDDGDPLWIAVADLALGALFLLAALTIWLRRDRHAARSEPWVDAVEDFTSGSSAGLGVVLSGANPKVVALSLGAALAVAQTNAGAAELAGAMTAFAAIGALGVLLPILVYLAAPSRAEPTLRVARAWLGRHEAVVLTVLGVLVGALFVIDGLDSL